jgi:hypothetical protein
MNGGSNTKERRWGRRTLVTVAAMLGILAVGGSVALATIPGSDGVIHGCYTKSGGTLRVIDASVTACKSTETGLNWNVTGATGTCRAEWHDRRTGPERRSRSTGTKGRRRPRRNRRLAG